MQRCGGHVLGDQDHADITCLGLGDDLAHQYKVVFVGLIHSQGYKFHRCGFGLPKECKRFGESQVAPAFAKRGLHIFDQEVEVLYITADCAGNDRRCFGLGHTVAHDLLSFTSTVWPGAAIFCRRVRSGLCLMRGL